MSPKEDFEGALKQFEADLLSPIVPGELERWFVDLAASADAVSDARESHMAEEGRCDLAEIAEQDSEMFRRIDQLKDGDANCQNGLAALIERIVELKKLAPSCEPDELKMRNAVEGLVQQGADWMISAKRQELARDTWLTEAFTRDRGQVD
jgi:hypothetical protein